VEGNVNGLFTLIVWSQVIQSSLQDPNMGTLKCQAGILCPKQRCNVPSWNRKVCVCVSSSLHVVILCLRWDWPKKFVYFLIFAVLEVFTNHNETVMVSLLSQNFAQSPCLSSWR